MPTLAELNMKIWQKMKGVALLIKYYNAMLHRFECEILFVFFCFNLVLSVFSLFAVGLLSLKVAFFVNSRWNCRQMWL